METLFVDKKHRTYPSPGLVPKLYETLADNSNLADQWIAEYLSDVWHTWCPPNRYWQKQRPDTLRGAIAAARDLRNSRQAKSSKRHKLPWRVFNVVTHRFVMLGT